MKYDHYEWPRLWRHVYRWRGLYAPSHHRDIVCHLVPQWGEPREDHPT